MKANSFLSTLSWKYSRGKIKALELQQEYLILTKSLQSSGRMKDEQQDWI